MKKLIRGERAISLGVLLGMVAVFAVGMGVLLFVVDLRQVALRGQQTATAASQSEQALRAVIIARCQERSKYDQRFVQSAKDDVVFYNRILQLARESTRAKSQAQVEYIAAITQARDRKQQIVEQGVISNCSIYRSIPLT